MELLVVIVFCWLFFKAVGLAFHYILAVVSTPMFCVRYWIVSLFLWACLLMGTLYGKRQK